MSQTETPAGPPVPDLGSLLKMASDMSGPQSKASNGTAQAAFMFLGLAMVLTAGLAWSIIELGVVVGLAVAGAVVIAVQFAVKVFGLAARRKG